jgi:hypothetical protein
MSLRVWLPLNRDLRNQGLSNVTVANNGATFSDGCANFISDNGINTNVLVPMMEHTTRLSISFWMNPGVFDGSEHNLVGTTDWSWLLSYNNSSLIFRQWNSNGSSSSSATDAIQWIYGTGISANSWNFITLTWDGNNCKGYINGSQVFIRTNTGTITHRTITNTSNFWLKLAGGIYKADTTGFNGSIYDFRIYDHALSKKEVKELSKGLYLHYTFANPYVENTVNLNGTYYQNWSAYTSYWTIIENTLNSIKLKASRTVDNNTVALTNSSLLSQLSTNDIITISGYLYKGDVPHKASINQTSTYTDSYQPISFKSRDDGYFESTVKVIGSGSWIFHAALFGSTTTNDICYIKNLQIEKKDHATPYTPTSRTTTILSDNSGFGNDGAINGELKISSDSPIRYSNSAVFNGSNTTIRMYDAFDESTDDGILGVDRLHAYSFWIYLTSIPSDTRIALIGDSSNRLCFGFKGGNIVLGCVPMTSPTTTIPGAQYSTSNLQTNAWNHVAVNYSGTGDNYNKTITFYLNGVEQESIGNDSLASSGPHIGGRIGNGFLNCRMSDVRIYTTNLSVDYIKDLYRTGCSVDKNQNLHCYESNESYMWEEITRVTSIGSSTVTIPSSKYSTIGLFVVGGGGSGHGDFNTARHSGNGGNGGCVNHFIVPFYSGSTSAIVIVGGGGASVSSKADSNNGSFSSVTYNGHTYVSDGGYGGNNNKDTINTSQTNSGLGGKYKAGELSADVYNWISTHTSKETGTINSSTYIGSKGCDGVLNKFDPTDLNFYGSGGAAGVNAYYPNDDRRYPQISGGQTGGGKGGGGDDNNEMNKGGNGLFYGAGGGGGAFSSKHTNSIGGAGHQGIVIIYGLLDNSNVKKSGVVKCNRLIENTDGIKISSDRTISVNEIIEN